LYEYLLALADDELILGHRNSEWCGHAPILEEDIAFANIALDEIGHAMVWYGLAAELRGEDGEPFANRMTFEREAGEYRSTQFVELPKGDWAFSMVRQYLFDLAEYHWLAGLARSEHRPLAEAAAKIAKEETYHLRHTLAWVRRLGLGTGESQRRMQAALDELWGYALQLFEMQPYTEELLMAGLISDPVAIAAAWEGEARQALQEAGLKAPTGAKARVRIISRAEHTDHLASLLADMQSVARLDPNATW
jgi:ring-1,2-phenylacetyl-CoA epoxidase subunit PaaC